jgi:predicted TIM-barrel fold metal-dependent hydrolase
VVQPSFYGTDNSATLDALDALGGNGRGVAVVDPANAPAEMLADYHRRGVRGLRVNLYSGLGRVKPFDAAFADAAAVAKPMDWHVEVIVGIDTIAANAGPIARSNVPVVIDHYGVYGCERPDSAAARHLLDLLLLPHIWMKLSAPYRVGNDPLATRPDRAWLDAILNCGSERLVWGSDWPHTPPHEQQHGPDHTPAYRALSYGRLVDDFREAIGSAALVQQIMERNPAKLYGFR